MGGNRDDHGGMKYIRITSWYDKSFTYFLFILKSDLGYEPDVITTTSPRKATPLTYDQARLIVSRRDLHWDYGGRGRSSDGRYWDGVEIIDEEDLLMDMAK